MKYIVVEQLKTYVVLLSEDGQFYKAADLNYELGQTINNPVLMKNKKSSNLDLKWYEFKNNITMHNFKPILASLALILIIITGFFMVKNYQDYYLTPHSSIVMQINPEIEIILNRKGSVLQLDGKNEEGIIIIDQYELVNKDKTTVINDLIFMAEEMGFINDGDKVTFGINTEKLDLFEQYESDLRENIKETVTEKIKIVIEIKKANELETPTKYQTEITIIITEKETTRKTTEGSQTTTTPTTKPTTSQTTRPPVTTVAPTRAPTTTIRQDDDSDYDDSLYDDSDYDDSNYNDSAYDDSDYD